MKRVWILITAIVILAVLCTAGCGKSATADDEDLNTTASIMDTSETDTDLSSKEENEADKNVNATKIASPSINGALHVDGIKLVDEDENPVQLCGISSHGIAWFPEYINEDCFADLHSWGANVVRLALYTAESGGYCTDGDKETLKNLIKKGVEFATDEDMYVIIDWHILSEGSPTVYQKEAENFFDEMSKEFAKNNNVLYEICNEPNGSTDWSTIKTYAEDIIPIIRANDEDAVIIVGTPNWSQDVDKAAENPIEDYDNIMYTLHFYAATHKEDLRSKMTSALEAGLPIFVTEFGICDASGNGNIDENSANAWVDLMNQYNVSYVMWNLSNKDESSSIIKSSITKTSGFSESDLSASGKWIYNILQSALNGEEISNSKTSSEADTALSSTSDVSNKVHTAVSNGMTVTYSLTNSWETDGENYYMYNATVKNTSGADVDTWEVSLEFGGNVTVSDGWNATYSATGKELIIDSVSYNGQLADGETAEDIGFIIIY